MTEAQAKDKIQKLSKYADDLKSRIAQPSGKRAGPTLVAFLKTDLEKTLKRIDSLRTGPTTTETKKA